jgi:hypothetical protein
MGDSDLVGVPTKTSNPPTDSCYELGFFQGLTSMLIYMLNDGWSCAEIAVALLIDDDRVRAWYDLYAKHGITGLVVFNHQGSQSHLTRAAEVSVFDFVHNTLARATPEASWRGSPRPMG